MPVINKLALLFRPRCCGLLLGFVDASLITPCRQGFSDAFVHTTPLQGPILAAALAGSSTGFPFTPGRKTFVAGHTPSRIGTMWFRDSAMLKSEEPEVS